MTVLTRGGRTPPDLPDPRNGWVEMTYLVKAGSRGNGQVDVYAGNRFVVRVLGRIGYAAAKTGDVKFKLGHYRDRIPGSAMLGRRSRLHVEDRRDLQGRASAAGLTSGRGLPVRGDLAGLGGDDEFGAWPDRRKQPLQVAGAERDAAGGRPEAGAAEMQEDGAAAAVDRAAENSSRARRRCRRGGRRATCVSWPGRAREGGSGDCSGRGARPRTSRRSAASDAPALRVRGPGGGRGAR